MSQLVGAMGGIAIKFAIMAVVLLGLLYGARLVAKHLVRSNPHWSKETKSIAHALSMIAAAVVFGIFLIASAS